MIVIISIGVLSIRVAGGEIKFSASSPMECERNVTEIAKNLRSVDQRDQVGKALEDAEESPLVKTSEKLQVSVRLLGVFHALEYGTTNMTLASVLDGISVRKLEPWQEYLLEMARGRLAAQQKDAPTALKKVDWLISHCATFEEARARDPLCDAFGESLSGPKGPLMAGLLVAKGTMLEKAGKLEDAKDIYNEVVRTYPGTGWATSAKHGLLAIEGAVGAPIGRSRANP